LRNLTAPQERLWRHRPALHAPRAFATAYYDAQMRTLAVYLILFVLLAVSIGLGVALSYWPHWCAVLRWCAPGWPSGH